MPDTDTITIAAGHGLAVPLEAGRTLRVVNTHGTPVDAHVELVEDLNE